MAMLPTEILLIIAEISPESFLAMRSVSRIVRDYTTQNMDKYIKKFSVQIQTKTERYLKLPNGRKHGLYEKWFLDGKLHKKYNYFTGLRHGTSKKWHFNGELYKKSIYTNGKKNGLYQRWHTNGQLNYECHYIAGKLHGRCKVFYSSVINNEGDTQLCEEKYYSHGKLEGLHKIWYPEGSLQVKCCYSNGKLNGLLEEWHNNGQIFVRCFFSNGEHHGAYDCFDYEGKLVEHFNYIKGLRIY